MSRTQPANVSATWDQGSEALVPRHMGRSLIAPVSIKMETPRVRTSLPSGSSVLGADVEVISVQKKNTAMQRLTRLTLRVHY